MEKKMQSKDFTVWTTRWGWVFVPKRDKEDSHVLLANGKVVHREHDRDDLLAFLKTMIPANVNIFVQSLSNADILNATYQILHWRRHGTVHPADSLLKNIAHTMEWMGIPDHKTMRMADQLVIEEAAVRYSGFKNGA